MLVMEYLPLGNMLDQKPFTIEEVIKILYQGLTALEYLHSEGIAHHDIKPANILIESRMPLYTKLADFGWAKNTSEMRTICGSFQYSAPEIWKGSIYTAAVDIWSFGVVILEFAFGLPEMGKFDPYTWDSERWYRRLIERIEAWDADVLMDLLRSRMLKEDY